MHVGKHEIWPADWVGLGLGVSAFLLFLLGRRLNSASPESKFLPGTETAEG